METNNLRVLVSDDVNEEKLRPLSESGIEVVKETKLSPQALSEKIGGFDGLIVRSATKVTPEILAKHGKLKVIGRAGVGVDNVDIPAATERGIVVMNAPDGNTITTAEHTFALLSSLARNIPQAHLKLQGGTWDKKSFVGIELFGKTLGLIGLGRIGKHVAKIGQGYGMNIVAFDPFVTEKNAAELGIEICKLDQVFEESDFISIHTPVTDDTRGIIGERAFGLMKSGVMIVNCARGGLVDESALLKAIEEGKVAGAALDVFESEPLAADSPLIGNPKIITTPHLGASTREAQEGVALTVAEQIRDFLTVGELRNALNAPSLQAKELEVLAPYISLGEQIGKFQAQLTDSDAVEEIAIEYHGKIASMDAVAVTRAFLTGFLKRYSSRVNVVNAMHIAEERGIGVSVSYVEKDADSNSDINTRILAGGNYQKVNGKVHADGQARITQIGNCMIEAVPRGAMLYTRSLDKPGVVGRVGMILGESESNISHLYLGRDHEGGEASAVIELDNRPPDEIIKMIADEESIISVKALNL